MRSHISKSLACLAFAGLLATLPSAPTAAAPKVVTSIVPIHSLAAGVMQGVAEPTLMIKGGASPHTYTLRPSGARALQQADAIFWVGDDLESFLQKPLAALGGRARIVKFSELADLPLLDTREGGAWEEHEDHDDDHADAHKDDDHDDDHADAHKDDDHDDDHADAHKDDDHDDDHADAHKDEDQHEEEHDHAHGEKDLHLWLDPANARIMVAAIVETLGAIDPANAAVYEKNGNAVNGRLNQLIRDIEKTVAPVKGQPYLVFHDAYHYFERRFGTNAVGSLTVSPDRSPGAKRLAELREKIEHEGAVCVFAEPQFEPAVVKTLIRGTSARAGTLDPVGADLTPGPDAYFDLMENLAKSLADCLLPSS